MYRVPKVYCRNFDRMTSSPTTTMSSPEETLTSFIAVNPSAKYVFDSERGAPVSELCRGLPNDAKRECIMIKMQSKQLLQAMQDHGFFCQLPQDPTKTFIECTPIPK